MDYREQLPEQDEQAWADDGRYSDEEWDAEMNRQLGAYRAASPSERHAVLFGKSARWQCVFCGQERTSYNGTGSDIACCGEVGHVEPYTEE